MATDQTTATKLPVSFYVLSEPKAQDILGFMVQLVQTALHKSKRSILVLIDEPSLLSELDEALWTYDVVSFIPHQLLTTNTADDLLAPVLLGDYLPEQFKGIVLNATTRTVTDFIGATHNVSITRMLEIIKPDTASTKTGRAKYKHYQQLGYELTHFKV